MFLLSTLLPLLLCSIYVRAYCPVGSLMENTDKCLIATNLISDWESSDGVCQLMGGNLVSIHSLLDNNVTVDVVQQTLNLTLEQYYIGLVSYGNRWGWTDETPFNFSNFYNDRIARDNEIVVLNVNSDANGYWSIVKNDGDDRYPFICEVPSCPFNNCAIYNEMVTGPHLIKNEETNTFYFGHLVNVLSPHDALTECSRLGATLPIIHNAFENSKVASIRSQLLGLSDYFHIGLKYDGSNWIWQDGTNMTYSNWAFGQPKAGAYNVIMDCVYGYWYTTNKSENVICSFSQNTNVCNNK